MIELRIEQILKEKHMTVQELKKATKLSTKTLNNILQNNLDKVRLTSILKVADTLDVSYDYLVKRKHNKVKPQKPSHP